MSKGGQFCNLALCSICIQQYLIVIIKNLTRSILLVQPFLSCTKFYVWRKIEENTNHEDSCFSIASKFFVKIEIKSCLLFFDHTYLSVDIQQTTLSTFAVSSRRSKMRGSPQENLETSLIMVDKREIKIKKDRYTAGVEHRGMVDLGELVAGRNGRSANPFVNGADRIEKKISELRRRVHARKNKKMTAADRGRLLYSIQLLFRLDGINFKERFKERFSRKTNWSRHPRKELNIFFSPRGNKELRRYMLRDILLSAIFYSKEG